jgi:serine/threonine-protein kinase
MASAPVDSAPARAAGGPVDGGSLNGAETLVPSAWVSHADRTIRRTPPTVDTPEALSPADLAALAVPFGRELELIGSLGAGGMGVVRLARQVLLGREVAVKSANPSAPTVPAHRSLLQEAWAAAALEHPNVVPVYVVTVDEDGQPHVVMRRIEGRTWSELIARPAAVQAAFGARDTLAWHLGVLMQVCNAVHFAHSRGILHRDLKPDNVMVGAFGEVYVLDWGLAVRLGENGPARLPWARDEDRIVGTPRYMAPEMAAADGSRLTERTDVYLLGGLLLTVLTGQGPHPGEDVAATLAGIPSFEPKVPADTPARLARVLRRALATDPAARFPSAEALRLELQAFLEERNADGIAAEAASQLAALDAALAGEAPDRHEIYRHFGACRFGFQQALRAWPEHAAAATGLRDALLAVTRYELAQGDPSAAAMHLAEVDDPPAELVDRVLAARAAAARAEAELAVMRADADPTLGQRTRIFVFSLVMVIWTAIPLLAWAFRKEVTWAGLLGAHGGMFVLVVALVVWARDSLGRTSLNRRIAQMLIVVEAALVAGDLTGPMLGLSAIQVAIFDQLVFATVAGLLAEHLTHFAVLPAFAYFGALLVSAWRPELLLPATGACNGLVAITAFVKWAPAARGRLLRRTPEEREEQQRRRPS